MLAMRRTDLAELYTLLKIYNRSYGGVPEELAESVKEACKASAGIEKEGNTRDNKSEGSRQKKRSDHGTDQPG